MDTSTTSLFFLKGADQNLLDERRFLAVQVTSVFALPKSELELIFSANQPKQESKMTKETHEKLATEVALAWIEVSKNLAGVSKNPAAFGAMAAHAYLAAMAVLEKNASEEAATASLTPAQALFETLRSRAQSPESHPSSSKEPAPICPADAGVSA